MEKANDEKANRVYEICKELRQIHYTLAYNHPEIHATIPVVRTALILDELQHNSELLEKVLYRLDTLEK